jgi:PAS domain S-box-containing protein
MASSLEATLKRMNELQIAFVAKLGDRIKELSRVILQVDGSLAAKSEFNQKLLQQINVLAHNLAGTAGTFKHTVVYQKAKAIETLCLELLQESNTEITASWHKLLLELVVSLRGDVQLSGRPSIVESFSFPTTFSESGTDSTSSHEKNYYPVIVVDDDELLVNLIKEQAKHFEYHVIPLLSTEDLETAIDKYQPAAILIDVIFPDAKHSGIEMINQLKTKQKINCPVIFMSNRCDVTVRLDALRAGSDAYIVKPLDILELIRILDRLTRKLSNKKPRILLVDDDPLSSKFYELALTANDFICEVLLNPFDVINKAAAFAPDAILLDINMPNCNGFELAEIIRQDDSFTHIPLLFLTVSNTSEDEVHAMKSGGDDFLDKNADLSTLIAIIKGHVHRYKELDSVLARLKRDEIRFRSVTSSSNDAIISVDAKGRIVFWNEGAENIFGFLALETIGQPIELIIPPEHREKHHQGFGKLVEDKNSLITKRTIETTAIKKDHTLIDVELTYTKWISGNEKFYTTILRDITHRKQIEQELYNKEASLKAIVTSSGEGIITIDNSSVIETVNPKAAQIFGYQIEELIGQNVSILVPQPEKQHHDDYVLNSGLHAPRIIDHARELRGERKDGSLFSLELNVSPMQVNGERKFVGILHDITERKLFIDELLAAKAEAEAANKAKTQFLSSMSHELRTPLNAILGFTQILQTDTETPPNADQLDSLNHIYNAGMHLLALITEVLNLSRIESGNLEISIERVALVQCINECIEQLLPITAQSQVTINLPTEPNPGQILAINTDKIKLKQVINNLLSNAIKYNKPYGSVSVALADLGQTVSLSITDTGKGISEHLMSDLFKPFSRLGAEVGTIEGTGIGLTITKKLVEMMNGKIGVESEVNQGSTFWVELEKNL